MRMADISEEVLEMAPKLDLSFPLVKCLANEAADGLAKRGVVSDRLSIEICPF